MKIMDFSRGARMVATVAVVVASAVLLADCGSTRSVERRRHIEPDAAIAAQVGEGGAAQTVVATDTPAATAVEAMPTAADSVRAALDSLLSDTVLAFSQVGLSVVDLTTGEVIAAHNAAQRMRPASSEKVVTAIAALDVLGPSYAFATSLLTTGQVDADGTLRGDLYVRGGMDPLLTLADVRALAVRLRESGVRQVRGRLVADVSMKDGDEYGWGWCWDDENPVLTPMMVGGKPGLAAAVQNALRNAGVKVSVPVVVSGTAPTGARELASVRRPLTEVLQPMLKESDNLCAESVFYQMGRTRKQVAAVVGNVLARCGAGVGRRTVVADGSGLSLYNYQSADIFTRLLAYAASRPDSILVPLMQALPIASVDGTLRKRMAGTPAAANVRAKTGSVTAVSTLVGFTQQRSTGHMLGFAIMNQGVERMAQGRDFQDRVCVVLSR